MGRDIIKAKLDIIFKKIFTDKDNEDLLIDFLSSLLEIPKESMQEVSIKSSENIPEDAAGKFSIMDIKLKVDDKLVNIEMQIKDELNFKDRVLYYWSKLYSGELKSGEEYGELKQSISIAIVNYNLFDCNEYHSSFALMEKERHEILTNKCAIHFFELKKINKKVNKDDKMLLWLQLVNAESEEELNMLENTNIPEMKKAVKVIRNMSADEEMRYIADFREKTLHNEATALGNAKREGRLEGRQESIQIMINNMKLLGMSDEQIQKIINVNF